MPMDHQEKGDEDEVWSHDLCWSRTMLTRASLGGPETVSGRGIGLAPAIFTYRDAKLAAMVSLVSGQMIITLTLEFALRRNLFVSASS